MESLGKELSEVSDQIAWQFAFAIQDNDQDEVRRLLDSGIDCNKPIEYEQGGVSILPLSLACLKGHVDIVRLLLNSGAEVNIPSQDGRMPIHCIYDRDEKREGKANEIVEILNLLVQHGVDVNVRDNMGQTALFLACEADDVNSVKALVQAGCDVNLQTVTGDSPLKVACRNAKFWSYFHGRDNRAEPINFPPVAITKLLLQHNADIAEATLLPTAVQMGDATLVKVLLDLGMDINMLDQNMCTPLGEACTSNSVSPVLVNMLLEHGADVNKGGGWKKQKPLIFAYVHNAYEKIRILLSYGASLSPEEVTELVSLSMSKSILENPEVVSLNSRELWSWRLLLSAGFNPIVQGTQLAYKLHQLSMCSSYDKISPWIPALLFPQRSLKECCRIAIRRNLKPSIDDNIKQLPLPRQLKSFLMFKEFSSVGEQ
ncbi:hypothetical protein CHS0354_012644 [Potamilus streckersoni]|uniref:SOCS box domain-containing protein n=1 Tax=Potamilus streckersoni TaxID=2493646 RepID=A0AAE0SXF0_9BIVA|nr:hypothetical protein CHS0354_012644 [Potamilus streckersoni]